MMHPLAFVLLGIIVGVGAAFTGLGGGFLIVPLLIILGYTPGKAVGTSFLAILLISGSALLAHKQLAHVDYRVGVLLGIGGILGAQLGAQVVDQIPVDIFKKIFAGVLVILALKLAWS
jgi:uncharacterized membrane protein YfcA